MLQYLLQQVKMSQGPGGGEPKKRGVENVEEFLKSSAPNGVILNGVLLWINIQRSSTTENILKNQLVKKVTSAEISDAKAALVDTVDENICTQAKIKNRQGINKSIHEIEDIINVMKKLDEANDLPIFLATSDMVKSVPILSSVNTDEVDISDVMNNVKMLENSVNSLMEQQKLHKILD